MEIIVTLEEAKEKCNNWKQFCTEKCISERYVCQGYVCQGYGDIKITLTKQECFKYGLLEMYE